MSTVGLARRFEELLKNLFEADGYTVAQNVRIGAAGAQIEVDLLVTSPTSGLRAVVEAKLYRSEQVGRGILLNAARQTEAARRAAHAHRGVLAITCRLDPMVRTELETTPNLIVYDYDVLAALLVH
ncbi:MAG: restriction endonuclease [Candidatus Binataceae bacterium]